MELSKFQRMAEPLNPATQAQHRANHAANEPVRGSQAIGDNVDVEGIRSSNHRENYLGHSILARKFSRLQLYHLLPFFASPESYCCPRS